MDFNAFVTGGWAFVPAEGEPELDGVGGSESEANTLGTPDDDCENENGFVDAFESDDRDDDDEEEEEAAAAAGARVYHHGMSLGSISSIRSAAVAASAAKLVRVKEKTQQVAKSKKQALSDFQKKGGLVGWLHGEPGDGSESCDDDGDPPATRQHHSFPALVSPRAASSQPLSTQEPATTFLKKSLRGRQRASSLLGNLYGKVKRSGSPAATPPATPTSDLESSPSTGGGGRIALQPSPRKERALQGACSFGFDEFASTSSSNDASKRHRQRAVSADSAPGSHGARFKPRQATTSAEPTAAVAEEARHALLLNDCLADPKLAAEFVNTVMPDDSTLLQLLYSIEEFDALVTTEPLPPLNAQIDYASMVIDKFLVPPPSGDECSRLGEQRSSSVLAKLPPSTAAELKQTIEQMKLTNASALPKTLFREVYDVVYESLREGYDSFKLTREYTLLLEQLQHEHGSGADVVNVATIDAILANEWCCTVFWMHLYRTSHHHRLSFLMDKTFRLDNVHAAFLVAAQSGGASIGKADAAAAAVQAPKLYERLVTQLKLVSRKFLHKSAPVAVPVAAAALSRLKEELCVEINLLPQDCSGHLDEALAVMERLKDKLDEFSVGVRKEFKHLSFERFASFTASALYRDFVANLLVLPPSGLSQRDEQVSEARSSKGDIVQLLRTSRIPFHQAPNEPSPTRVLSELFPSKNDSLSSTRTEEATVAPNAIFRVFTFAKRDAGESDAIAYEDITRANASSGGAGGVDTVEANEDAHIGAQQLYQTVEPFLLPEAATRALEIAEADAQQELCYNFVAGNGDNIEYGAVWRLPVASDERLSVHGVCVTSKFPLVDSLRCFLSTFAQGIGRPERDKQVSEAAVSAAEPFGGDLHTAVGKAREAFEQHLLQHHAASEPTPRFLPQLDVSLDDLFDCLSLSHILRLVAFVLLEKKVVLVSSRYSVLVSVGEALKALIYPLTWSHIYVPVLPLALKGYLHCPTPFIFGLHTSYVRASDLPRPSDDLVIVNLDRDSLTGGGEVFLSPALSPSLRDKLHQLCKPRLQVRDRIDFSSSHDSGHTAHVVRLPAQAIRDAFHEQLLGMLSSLESFAFRFEFGGESVAVVDASNRTRVWAAEATRFHATLLQTQAFSAHLSSLGGQRPAYER